MLSVAGTELFYYAVGSGDPVLVVHGGPGMDHSYLRPGMEILARSHRVVFYDQRGLGRSADADTSSISFEGYLADLDGVRAALGIERLNLIGHSWGALLATVYAIQNPERVASLILMSPVEPGQRYAADAAKNQASRRSRGDSVALVNLMETEGFRERDATTINQIFRVSLRSTFANPALADQLVLDMTERTARMGSEVARLVMAPLGEYDFWDELDAITAPTLIIHGEADPIPEAMARELAERIPNARLALLPGVGHFPFVEAPEALSEEVRAFLATVE